MTLSVTLRLLTTPFHGVTKCCRSPLAKNFKFSPMAKVFCIFCNFHHRVDHGMNFSSNFVSSHGIRMRSAKLLEKSVISHVYVPCIHKLIIFTVIATAACHCHDSRHFKMLLRIADHMHQIFAFLFFGLFSD